MEHAEGVDGEHFYLAVGLFIEVCRHVEGQSRYIDLALDEQRADFLRVGVILDVVGIGTIGLYLGETEACRAVESGYFGLDFPLVIRLGSVGNVGILPAVLTAAGGKRKEQEHCEHEG